jgi:hypothetical protein
MKPFKVRHLVAALRAASSAGLAVAIAVVGALALSNWSVCEQYDRACLISTSSK